MHFSEPPEERLDLVSNRVPSSRRLESDPGEPGGCLLLRIFDAMSFGCYMKAKFAIDSY